MPSVMRLFAPVPRLFASPMQNLTVGYLYMAVVVVGATAANVVAGEFEVQRNRKPTQAFRHASSTPDARVTQRPEFTSGDFGERRRRLHCR